MIEDWGVNLGDTELVGGTNYLCAASLDQTGIIPSAVGNKKRGGCMKGPPDQGRDSGNMRGRSGFFYFS